MKISPLEFEQDNNKPRFEVTTPDYKELTIEEQANCSNNGSGKEWANYIRVSRLGKTVWLENDAMEPEDSKLSRDLSWVKEAIEYAYQCGLSDGVAKSR